MENLIPMALKEQEEWFNFYIKTHPVVATWMTPDKTQDIGTLRKTLLAVLAKEDMDREKMLENAK